MSCKAFPMAALALFTPTRCKGTLHFFFYPRSVHQYISVYNMLN